VLCSDNNVKSKRVKNDRSAMDVPCPRGVRFAPVSNQIAALRQAPLRPDLPIGAWYSSPYCSGRDLIGGGQMAMDIISRQFSATAALALALAVTALPAWPDSYPSRPIHLIVNYVPGGTGDIIARLIGARLGEELGQSVVVENRSGAGGTLGTRVVVNADPDGYTLTVAQTPEIAINPYFMKAVGYDPQKDLQPIALGGVVPLALAVPANAPYSTIGEFIAFLRSTDKPLTFASGGVGSSGHLAGELLKLKINNKLTHVPYKGAGQALTDLVGGQVDFYFPGLIAAMPMMRAGKLKILAMATTTRSPAAPDIPTVAEATGISNFDFTLWAGFFGPRALPAEITAQLHTAVNKIIFEPDINARLQDNGVEISAPSIDQFSEFVRREIEKYQLIIKEADLKSE
jgi:tripartite-type tricarboxylate transporter receptor subunit TctC